MAVSKKSTPKTGTALTQRAQVNLPAAVQEAMNADIAAFQQRMSAPVGNRIAVTQDKKFKNAAGEKFDTIRGVIVDFVAKKAFYESDYDKDDVVPPNCFALGFVPHDALEASENSPEVQHQDGCKTCPKNAFKSAANGKGKACKDSYILALLPPDAEEGTPLVTLSLSATAIKPFEKYVRDLARDYGKAPYCFITEFTFDNKMDYASVRCEFSEVAESNLIGLAYSLRDDASKMLGAEPDCSEFEEKVVAKRAGSKKAGSKAAAARR